MVLCFISAGISTYSAFFELIGDHTCGEFMRADSQKQHFLPHCLLLHPFCLLFCNVSQNLLQAGGCCKYRCGLRTHSLILSTVTNLFTSAIGSHGKEMLLPRNNLIAEHKISVYVRKHGSFVIPRCWRILLPGDDFCLCWVCLTL